VGPPELERIRASGGRAFPRRGHHEPVFGIAATEEQARRVAREWNAEGRVGYVTSFEVDAEWCERYVAADPGDGQLWISTETVPDLNAHLVGEILVLSALRPPPATRTRS
jgi:hypothetical protein